MKYRGPIKSIKVLLLFLALSVLLAAILPPGRAVHAVDFNGFDGGTGTLSDPYLISTPTQLDSIRNNLSKSFKLTADIDLSEYGSGAGWVPIGTLAAGRMFQGNLDGDGHAITNLTINRPTADYVGLFGVLSGGRIKNLRIVGSNITAKNYAGPLAGRVWGIYEGQQSVISNSSSSGGSLTGAGWLGGLVGDSLRNTIDNCYSSTAVSGTNSVIGGLVGVIGQGTIDKSYATGNVTAGGIAVGGLVGFNSSVVDISLPSLIRASYATGDVEGNKSVGGLVGINENSASSLSMSVISDSYAVGKAKGAERVGGLVGYNHTASILNSYAIGAVEGMTEKGGLVGASATDRILLSYYDKETTGINVENQSSRSTEQMKTLDTYTGWEFNGTWAIHSSIHVGYPYLPAAVLPATATLGQGAGTTKVTATASAGNRLVVQVSANNRAAPGFGDVVPSSGVTDPYLPGADIGGVDAATHKYVSVYEANKDGKVVKFMQITLTEDDILTYAIDELSDQILGALTVGYASGSQSTHSITVSRKGTGNLSQLYVEASGDAFTVTQPAATTLDAAMPSTTFAVIPNDGLGVGTHTSIVTVTADHMTPRTFTVTQVVNAPGAPSLQISNVGNAQVTLDWSAINDSTGYRIYKRTSSGVFDREEATVTSATYRYPVTGLVNGTNYSFIVRAVIGGVEGADSNEVSATPMTVPGAPTNVTATAGDGQASVEFVAPSDNGGSFITNYKVLSSPGGLSNIGTASPIVITGLSNGTTYTFSVIATNSKGEGQASEASNAVMHPIGVPIQQSPIEGDKQVTLNWSAVGEATGYRIYKSTLPGIDGTAVDTVSAATLSYTVTGLINSRSYYFTIRAMNSGVESAASNEVVAMPVRWAGPGAPAGTFAGGNGIEEDPYLIADAAQLNAVRNYLNGSFRLAADIDLSGYANATGWVPIGSNAPAGAFSGNMDGDRYAITGLKINRPTDDYVGLFGFVTGNIANLTLDAANIVGRDYVGGVAGFVKYGTISNSRISGAVTGNNDVGGLVGKVFPGKVGNSFNTANVTGYYRIGGLVGSGSDAATISDSHSAGNVTGIADSFYIGGLIGQIDGSRAIVRNSYATGEVQGANEVGGLAGASLAANIETSYSMGDVTASWSAGGLVGMNNFGTITDSYTRSGVTVQMSRIGGFVGYNAGTTVTHNYAAGSVTGGASARGGFAGSYVGVTQDSNYYDLSRIGSNDVFAQPVSTTLMKTIGTYADWDFNHTWGIEETLNDGYPYLRHLAPDLPATAAPGDGGETTKVTAEPSFGNHLVIQVSSREINTPKIGDAVPSPGVTNPYIPGSDIGGVDEVTNKYIVVYEADNNNRVLKFAQLTLTSGEISPSYQIERVNDQSLPTLIEGYAPGMRETKTIPITRIGTGDLVNLAVTVSGTSFELTQPTVTTLNDGTPSTRFTVKAKERLAAGTYTATVTISADHMANATFTVTQVVLPVRGTIGAPGAFAVPPSRTTMDLGDENTGATLQVRADVQTSGSGATFSHVEVDDDVLVQLLGALKGKKTAFQTVTIVVEGGAAQVVVDLPTAALRNATVANARGTLIVRTDFATYALPLSLLRELSKDSSEEKISIAVNRIIGSLLEKIERAAKEQQLLLLNTPTEFKITIGDQERSDFGENYVERIVQVESKADPSKATAVRYDPVTESFRFVPSTFKTKDKATEVVMKSTHNSIYMVIRTEKTFSDLRGNWAKENMELLASKLIVKGLSATEFGPGASITRAEFTALLVRSLGLGAIASDRPFRDVNAKSWYFDDVQAAVNAGLVKGFADGTFRPDDRITREQMTVIMAAALRFVGKEPAGADENKPLDRFTDKDKIHSWALDAAAISVKAGMITGREDATFAPTAFASRAEVGSMLVRMLRYIQFIN